MIEPAGPEAYDAARDPYQPYQPYQPAGRRVDLHETGETWVGSAPGQLAPGPVATGPVATDPLAAVREDAARRDRLAAAAQGSGRRQPALKIGPRHDTRDGGLFRRRRSAPAPPSAPAGRGRVAFSAATEIVVVLVMALALSFVIKTFLVQAFFIPSESMYTTLLKGDRVLVSKLTPGPFALHRGDVVVFKDPGGWLPAESPPVDSAVKGAVRQTLTFIGLLPTDSGEHLIKRVIGLPGDTVACCDAGKVTINGVPIDEQSYLDAGDQPSTLTFKVTVPADNLWVMGDHRSVSEDSRRHLDKRGGFVPISDVVGKAFVIVWPFDRVGGISVPGSVYARVPDPPPAK